MTTHLLRRATKLAVAYAICAGMSIAQGQVYKCTDGTGRTTYSDAPCDSVGKPRKLPDDAKGRSTSPSMCAQLLDETRRLAAEADREARHGRTESASSAKRRQSLIRQYEARCVGIARSDPPPK